MSEGLQYCFSQVLVIFQVMKIKGNLWNHIKLSTKKKVKQKILRNAGKYKILKCEYVLFLLDAVRNGIKTPLSCSNTQEKQRLILIW